VTVIHGDCLEVMAAMEPESVDAIVTDPPYGLEFMGKEWDRLDSRAKFRTRVDGRTNPRSGKSVVTVPEAFIGGPPAQQFHSRWAEAAYRVAKPSAYLLAFGGTRTVHRMTVALEDAGWIIRDMLVWGYASGFPKSKASLKPAWEPIVMARKPGPLRDLAIDACRIGTEETLHTSSSPKGPMPGDTRAGAALGLFQGKPFPSEQHPAGRWPANIVLTDPIFDGGIEGVVGGGEASYNPTGVFGSSSGGTVYGNGSGIPSGADVFGYGDSGTYSRFFLIPKADRSDREPVLGGLPLSETVHAESAFSEVCANCNKQRVNVPGAACVCPDPEWVRRQQKPRANVHPTVKPTDLMRHLVRLVTPTGGTVLDPFLGSGTTALAAEMEGFPWIGIEREAEYVAIAEARLNGVQRGLGLETA
jgi:DNA modification methylase